MFVGNKVDAIKAMRANAQKVEIVLNRDTERFELKFGSGLKEDKDLVEAIMALGVQSYLATVASDIDDLHGLIDDLHGLINRLKDDLITGR